LQTIDVLSQYRTWLYLQNRVGVQWRFQVSNSQL